MEVKINLDVFYVGIGPDPKVILLVKGLIKVVSYVRFLFQIVFGELRDEL